MEALGLVIIAILLALGLLFVLAVVSKGNQAPRDDPTVYFGILGISFGLLQFPLFKNRESPLRFLLNSFFVLGAFLILVEIDTLVQSVVTDLFLILLIVFWIFTRISLSQWDHKRICYACNVEMCEFFI